MLPPKALLDALGSHASRLFNGDTPLPAPNSRPSSRP